MDRDGGRDSGRDSDVDRNRSMDSVKPTNPTSPKQTQQNTITLNTYQAKYGYRRVCPSLSLLRHAHLDRWFSLWFARFSFVFVVVVRCLWVLGVCAVCYVFLVLRCVRVLIMFMVLIY